MGELSPLVQRISAQYDPTGMTKFLGQLGSVAGISALAVAGIGAVVGVMATCVVKTMSWGKSLDDVMKLLGVTSKEAAGLKLIADATGVSIDTLTRGLDIMGKNLVTVDGKLGTAGKALKSLGVDIYDANGQLKRTPDLLSEVADKMAKMKDGTEKTRLEMLLFGRSGTDVDEVLRQAANGGMQKYIDQAQKMGLVLTPAQIEQVHNLGTNIDVLKDQMEGIAVVVGITLIPVLQSLVTWLGNVLSAIMPDIENFGRFLLLLTGMPATTPTVTIPGNPGSIENQWRVAHGYTPNERYGAMPTEATTGTAPGGPGGESVDTVIYPWMKNILDIKNNLVNWFGSINWPDVATALTGIASYILNGGKTGTPTKGMFQGGPVFGTGTEENDQWWADHITSFKSDIETGKLGLEIDNWWTDNVTDPFKKAVTIPIETGQVGMWLDNNIFDPVNNFFDKNFTFPIRDWFTKNITTPIQDWLGGNGNNYSSGFTISDWWKASVSDPLDTWYVNVHQTLENFGTGIGTGILGLINILIGYYDQAITVINKILGIKIPTIPQRVTAPTISSPAERFASGGWLTPWALVGEAGSELIDPSGYVHPHGETMAILPMLGKVRQLGFGGYADAQAWLAAQAMGSAPSGMMKTMAGDNTRATQAASYVGPALNNTMSGGGDSQATVAATVSEAVTPAVAVVAQSGVEMVKASQQTVISQSQAVISAKSQLEEIRGLRQDFKHYTMVLTAEIQKAMAA